MRPIDRGGAPQVFTNYADAKPHLVERLGLYCSYCERRVPTNLAVEHIQPKSLPKNGHLINEWTNFLLACVNCNSAKKNVDVQFDQLFFPDRDNTFRALDYQDDGQIAPNAGLPPELRLRAEALIALCGLNNNKLTPHPAWEHDTEWSAEDLRQAALERWGQRAATAEQAIAALRDYNLAPGLPHARTIAKLAASTGFFSIWMRVFANHVEVRRLIVGAFVGTDANSFDANGTALARPGGAI